MADLVKQGKKGTDSYSYTIKIKAFYRYTTNLKLITCICYDFLSQLHPIN